MKIITWNVNGLRAIAKKPNLINLVEREQPDILCLQETKAHPDQIDKKLHDEVFGSSFHDVGYWSAAQRPGYSGTATFTKIAPTSVGHGIGIRKFDNEGRFVVTDHDDFLLYNVYFPNGGSGLERHEFKQEFLRKFTHHLETKIKAGREIVLVGDYNVAHTAIDVYDPEGLAGESGFLVEERRWFDTFLASGFVDLFRQFHPGQRERYTWWHYLEKARLGNRGWRIDYICATKGLAKKFTSCEVRDDIQGSDHCPVVAELK